MDPKVKSLSESIIAAGYKYAKSCFEDFFSDDDKVLRLPDGRIDPNGIAIYDAAGEALGGFPDELIELDPAYFPGEYSIEKLYDLMTDLLDGEEDYLFIEGEKEYIKEIYGEDWER